MKKLVHKWEAETRSGLLCAINFTNTKFLHFFNEIVRFLNTAIHTAALSCSMAVYIQPCKHILFNWNIRLIKKKKNLESMVHTSEKLCVSFMLFTCSPQCWDALFPRASGTTVQTPAYRAPINGLKMHMQIIRFLSLLRNIGIYRYKLHTRWELLDKFL